VTDFFALLGLPRRPAVDEGFLQERYLRLAAAWHPDGSDGDVEKFRELQEARKTLFDPAARLRHLLVLEGYEGKDGGAHGAPELFLEVAGALDAVKRVRNRLTEARSAIGRAALEPERRRVEQQLLRVSDQIATAWNGALEQLGCEDARWPSSDLPQLERIGKKVVFLARWRKELREGLFSLQNITGA